MYEFLIMFLLHPFFFFFQAEDGIRDIGVTGVQTCALPILLRNGGFRPSGRNKPASEYLAQAAREGRFPRINNLVDVNNLVSLRSEERREGKECRSRWSAYL